MYVCLNLKVSGATTTSVGGGIQLQYTAAASTVTSGVVSGSGTGVTAADGTFQQQLLLQSPAFCKLDHFPDYFRISEL